MPKFFIKTYGCQMNERDSEQVAYSLITRGYERVEHEADADVVLLNTCSVRDMADQKALGKMGMLGRMAKERPHVVFGFLGCMAQAQGASLLRNLPHLAKARSCSRGRRPRLQPEENGRSAIFHRRHWRGARVPGNDSETTTQGKTGDGLRLDHARLQYALHFLHRAADARSGAQQINS